MRRNVKTLVFDFDGTLVDSMSLVHEIYNSMAARFGVPEVSIADLPRLRRMTPTQIITSLEVPLWKIPQMMRAVRAALTSHIDRLEPIRGVREALEDLRRSEVRCLLLTSNSRQNVERFLSKHELQVFEDLSCGSSSFGKGTRLKQLLAQHALKPSEVAYVGDEVRDVEAARAVGANSAAVTWGYADREALLLATPDCVIEEPRQLLDLCTLPLDAAR